MTKNLTIGRFGLSVDVRSAWEWSESGPEVQVSGVTVGVTVDNAIVLRQQLNGYVDSPDEDFVPVTWADDPTVNGFYRVLSVSFDPLEDDFDTRAGVFGFEIRLRKVSGYAAPLFESVLLGALRVNAHSITSGTSVAYHALPDESSAYDAGPATPDIDGRIAEDGTMLVYSGASNLFYDDKPSFHLPPADFYRNAATVKVGGNVVVGREVANSPTSWEMSNGLIKVGSGASSSSPTMILHFWKSGAWVTGRTFSPALRGASSFGVFTGPPDTFTVLRNSPELAVVRLTYDSASAFTGGIYPVVLDIALRRGSRMAECRISTRGIEKWGVMFSPFGSTMTSLTGGGRETISGNPDAIVVGSPNAHTLETGGPYGARLTTAGTRFDFGVGIGLAYATATGIETPQSLIYQYMAAQDEKVTVVAR